MTSVLSIKNYSTTRAATRAKAVWRSRFPEGFDPKTRLGDLTDQTLLDLARLGEDISSFLNRLCLAILDFPKNLTFEDLPGRDKLQVLDASLFLIDQIRWETLRRLGWVECFAGERYPLVELIINHQQIKASFAPPFPDLTDAHPDYVEFQKRRKIDGEAMIRSLIPAALAGFAQRL